MEGERTPPAVRIDSNEELQAARSAGTPARGEGVRSPQGLLRVPPSEQALRRVSPEQRSPQGLLRVHPEQGLRRVNPEQRSPQGLLRVHPEQGLRRVNPEQGSEGGAPRSRSPPSERRSLTERSRETVIEGRGFPAEDFPPLRNIAERWTQYRRQEARRNPPPTETAHEELSYLAAAYAPRQGLNDQRQTASIRQEQRAPTALEYEPYGAQDRNEDEEELWADVPPGEQPAEEIIEPRRNDQEKEPAAEPQAQKEQNRDQLIEHLLALLTPSEKEELARRSWAQEAGTTLSPARTAYSPPMNAQRNGENNQQNRRPYSPPLNRGPAKQPSNGQTGLGTSDPVRRQYAPPMYRVADNQNEDENRNAGGPPRRQYSPPMKGGRTYQDEAERLPQHSVLQQRPGRTEAPVGSTYLPRGALPGRDGVQRFTNTENVTRQPIRLDPIMDPVGAPGATGPQHTNMLYGPPLPIYEALEEREFMAAKTFAAPRFATFGGTPEEEGQRARHFMDLVQMHAAVTRGVTDNQKILIAVTNMKGAASEWYFTTNDRHAELYGGKPLFDSWPKFKDLFLQRFGQMNTANAMAKLETVKLKKGESVATFAQTLENLFYSANLVDEQAKLYSFFRAIADPLKSQVRGCKPLTLNQAIQDAIHFDQRMSKEEQQKSRFAPDPEDEASKQRNRNERNTVNKAEAEDQPAEAKRGRPLIGKAKAKFPNPQKNDPMAHEKNKREGEIQGPHFDINCYNCGEAGHYATTCRKPQKERANTRTAVEEEDTDFEEEEDPLIDSPEEEPDFDEPALIRLLDAYWDADEDSDNQELATEERTPAKTTSPFLPAQEDTQTTEIPLQSVPTKEITLQRCPLNLSINVHRAANEVITAQEDSIKPAEPEPEYEVRDGAIDYKFPKLSDAKPGSDKTARSDDEERADVKTADDGHKTEKHGKDDQTRTNRIFCRQVA